MSDQYGVPAEVVDRIVKDLAARGLYDPATATAKAEAGEWTQRDSDSADAPEWDDPTPLAARPALPAFPVDALPAWIADEVHALAEFTQTPPDLAATTTIAVLSTAAGGRVVVEVRGSWREPVNLYLVVAMPPGSRKSPVFSTLTSPLLRAEQHLIDKTKPEILEAQTSRKVKEVTAQQAAAAAAKAKADADRLMAEAIGAAQMAEAITVPTLPRLVADDVTTEAAASLLADQGGRLAVLSAEGGIFTILAGRYSGGVPSLDVFLKGHAGDLLLVDRKGRPPEHIERPALTLGLAVQPEVLRQIAHMPGFRGRGLLARILYAVPENNVGRRKVGTPPVPPEIQDAYDSNVQALTASLHEWTDPAVLVLDPAAGALLLDHERDLEPRLHPETGDLGHVADWASKLVGATVRLAGLLHLGAHLTDGWGRAIDLETMVRAVDLAGYFTAHALAAFDQMGVDPALEGARVVLDWLARTQPTAFTRRDAFTSLSRTQFPKVGDLDPALELLVEHGYIRPLSQEPRTGPGRPRSPVYLVHPSLAAETA